MIKLSRILDEVKVVGSKHFDKPPEGWTEFDIDPKWNAIQGEEGETIKGYSAPMDGYDDNHEDNLYIIKKKDNTYRIEVTYAFATSEEEPDVFPNLNSALVKAFKIMQDIVDGWPDEDGDLDEKKHPESNEDDNEFNTDEWENHNEPGDDEELDPDDYLNEENVTGGGVAGATFNPGVGEQYASPKAFGKKKKNKMNGYKIVPKNKRFKAKVYDVANWASNSPKYLNEIRVTGDLRSSSISLAKQVLFRLKPIKEKLLVVTVKEALYGKSNLEEFKTSLEEDLAAKLDAQRSELQKVMDNTDTDKDGGLQIYNEYGKIDDKLVEVEKAVDAVLFIIDEMLSFKEKITKDSRTNHHFKQFNKI